MINTVARSLSYWDYGIIVFYFAFVLSIGWMFRRINRNASDYFRGGGNMLWWVAGMGTLVTEISAWTFTGGAAKCYDDGFIWPMATLIGAIPSFILLYWIAPRLRRFRVITAMEAVFRRFGGGTEQLYTWTALPLGLFFGGVGLNTVAVFMSSVFHADMVATTLIIGGIVMVMSVLGGQWSVTIGAFVQGLMMFLIVIVVVVLSVNLPEIGGITNLLNVLPERHVKFDTNAQFELVWIWFAWQAFNSLQTKLDLRNSGKFVRVKDDGHARRMVLLMAFPTLILLLPLWMQLPAMCAAVVFPDMHALFPQLKNPAEAAWVAMSFKVLPQGLLGVLVCGIFSAAIDSLDTALNTNAGYFVRNVYTRYMRRLASDREQLYCGKAATLAFGLLVIVIALQVNEFRKLNLFDFFQLFNAIVIPPMAVPMIFGLFIKRTPAWSGWSTVIFGLLISVSATWLYSPELIQQLMNYVSPLNRREVVDSQYVFVGLITFLGSMGWFLMTMLFYGKSSQEQHERVESLFTDLARPIERGLEHAQDIMQYRMIGLLCMVFGGFMLTCILIPNPLYGRMAFLFIGGVMTGLGAWLWWNYRRLLAQSERQKENEPCLVK